MVYVRRRLLCLGRTFNYICSASFSGLTKRLTVKMVDNSYMRDFNRTPSLPYEGEFPGVGRKWYRKAAHRWDSFILSLHRHLLTTDVFTLCKNILEMCKSFGSRCLYSKRHMQDVNIITNGCLDTDGFFCVVDLNENSVGGAAIRFCVCSASELRVNCLIILFIAI